MKEIIGTVATTHLIQRGEFPVRVSKEALESGARQANGDRAIPITVDHDPFCMPLGKSVEAWVEPLGGEYALKSRIYIEDAAIPSAHEKSGVEIVHLGFKEASKPLCEELLQNPRLNFRYNLTQLISPVSRPSMNFKRMSAASTAG